jgi:hypothetical protein
MRVDLLVVNGRLNIVVNRVFDAPVSGEYLEDQIDEVERIIEHLEARVFTLKLDIMNNDSPVGVSTRKDSANAN